MRMHPAMKQAKAMFRRAGIDVLAVGTLSMHVVCREYNERPLIVDIKLPDMDSLEFLRTLRALPTPRRPFVGVLMVEFDLPTLLRCRRAGADAHLMKPFTAAQMNARLDEIEAERLAKAA